MNHSDMLLKQEYIHFAVFAATIFTQTENFLNKQVQ